MSLRFATRAVLLSLILSGCVVDDVTQADKQRSDGDLTSAKETLERLAIEGYHDAKLSLARLYGDESSPLYNTEEARHWYSEAVKANDDAWIEFLRWQIRSSVDTEYLTSLYDSLWRRQETEGDALPLLVSLYRSGHEFLDAKELVPLLEAAFENGEEEKVLEYGTRLFDISPFYETLVDYCNKNRAQHITLNCLKTELISSIKADNYQTTPALISTLKRHYNADELSAKEVTEVAYLARDRRLSEPNLPLFFKLGDVIGTDLPDFWYESAKSKIRYVRSDNSESSRIVEQAKQLSDDGYVPANLILAQAYEQGLGTRQSYQNAAKHWQLAIVHPEAKRQLGELYLSGVMGINFLQQGVNLMVQAAREGDDASYLKLAEAFNDGNGIVPNPSFSVVFAALHHELTLSEKSLLILDSVNTDISNDEINARVDAEKAARIASMSRSRDGEN